MNTLLNEASSQDQLLKTLDDLTFSEISADDFFKKFPEFKDKIRKPIEKVWGLKMRAGAYADTWVIKVNDKYSPYITYIKGNRRDHSGAMFVSSFLNKISGNLKEQLELGEKSDNLSYIGNCTDDEVVDHIFGDASGFANAVEEYGDDFVLDDLVVKYDPKTDIHSFYYKEQFVTEKLSASQPASAWIRDFIDSTNPKFKGKTKKERISMALGAYYAAQKNEEYGAGFEGTDELRKKYIQDTPGQRIQQFKTEMNQQTYKTYQEFEAQHQKMYPYHNKDQIQAAWETYSKYFKMEEDDNKMIKVTGIETDLDPTESQWKMAVATQRENGVKLAFSGYHEFSISGPFKKVRAAVIRHYGDANEAEKMHPQIKTSMSEDSVQESRDFKSFSRENLILWLQTNWTGKKVSPQFRQELDAAVREAQSRGLYKNIKIEPQKTDAIQERIDIRDYMATSEKSQFGGYRPHVVNKEGKTMYLAAASYNTPDEAKAHAEEYLKQYARGISEPRVPIKGTYVKEGNKDKSVELEETVDFRAMKDDSLKQWLSKNDTDDSVSPVFGAQILAAKKEAKRRGISEPRVPIKGAYGLKEEKESYDSWIIKPREGPGDGVKVKAPDETSAIEIALGRKPSQNEIDFFNFHYILIQEKTNVSTLRNMKIVELATNCYDSDLVKEYVEQHYKSKTSALEIKESFRSFVSNKTII